MHQCNNKTDSRLRQTWHYYHDCETVLRRNMGPHACVPVHSEAASEMHAAGKQHSVINASEGEV